MKRLYFSLFALLLLLCGCAQESASQTPILVNIRETADFTVENNGQYILPGEDAVFTLRIKDGLALADTDYDGDQQAVMVDGKLQLTLEDVKYSSHVSLQLTDSYMAVTYDPNGAPGEVSTCFYDTTVRQRPNTATELFQRDGHTLVSWNTRPDGTGERIGLGSRVTVPQEGLTLYAQWAKWSDAQDFQWTANEEGVTVTGYHGSDTVLVIPAAIEGNPVTAIAAGAFRNCPMTQVVFPNTLKTVEDGAFESCGLDTLVLFDNIETIGDGAFVDCQQLSRLCINAVEKPYGFNYRKESCYADKVDLLLQAKDEKKIIFYGGCSMWFNLDGDMLQPLTDQGYRVINMGLNGLADSGVQLQIIEHFLKQGDIFFHAPELSSAQQMMITTSMDNDNGDKLWCGLEYNYDLFTLVDMRTVPGVLDSLCGYLSIKKSGTDYADTFVKDGNTFCDAFGCIPFYRDKANTALYDEVYMDPSYITEAGMARLKAVYDRYQSLGVRIYVSHACVNMDEVAEEQRASVGMVQWQFKKAIEAMDGPVLISELEDFLYQRSDFYDTNYHLLSEPARQNTAIWLRDVQAQMEQDGLWEAP